MNARSLVPLRVRNEARLACTMLVRAKIQCKEDAGTMTPNDRIQRSGMSSNVQKIRRAPGGGLTVRSYSTSERITTALTMVMMISTLRVQFLLLLGSLWLAGTTTASNEEGVAFLAANKVKEGVVQLPSGMQYKVLQKGDGAYHPKPSTPCSVHYTGSLIDGTVFDSSVERGQPATFAPNQVVKGWTEA